MKKLIGIDLNLPPASQRHFNYFSYKLISKDTLFQLWNSQTEPNGTEGILKCNHVSVCHRDQAWVPI